MLHIIIYTIIILGITIKLTNRNKKSIQNIQPFDNLWDKEKLDKIKKLLKNSAICLKKLNIEFMPVYGSLLGLIRNKGLIPWDDDMDIAIDRKYFKIVLSNKELFKQYGIGVYLYKGNITYSDFIKLYDLNEKNIKNCEFSWPFIDIFGYYIIKDYFFLESNVFPINKYRFDKNDILPFKTNMFEDIPMNIPYNSDLVLNKLYGNDWENTCYSSSYNHREEIFYNKQYKIKCNNIKLLNVGDEIFNNVWTINLERRPDRLYKTFERLQKIGINSKRYNAIDSKSIYTINFYNKISKPKIGINEFACYLSHKYLWEYIYFLNIPYAIIFEDDIIIEENINKQDILNFINKSTGFNILFLGHCYSNESVFYDTDVIIGTAMCLNAYVITREAIEKLINIEDNFSKPVDHLTYKFCEKEICYLSKTIKSNNYGEGIIKQDYDINSDIVSDRTILNFLKRYIV